METSNADLIEKIARGDIFVASEAAERCREVVGEEDLPLLIQAYETRLSDPRLREWTMRSDLVDLISIVGNEGAHEFLHRVARSRTTPHVRYNAMKALIELEVADWRPGSDTPRKLRSSFYASLIAYERYRRGEFDLRALQSLVPDLPNGPGNYWQWIPNLDPRPGEDPEWSRR